MTSIPQSNFEIAPIRSLDDFLLGSARFQLPKFNDLEKWGNRVAKNLLYYQTNYGILFTTIYLLMALLNPVKIISGLLVEGIIIGIVILLFNTDDKFNLNQNPKHKWYYLAGTLIISYLVLAWFDAIFLSAFTLFIPFLGTFVHASLRLRNIKNKAVNLKETWVPTSTQTPMSLFLNIMNIKVDSF